MSFYPVESGWEIKYFRKKASTAFAVNSLVGESSALDTIEPAIAADAALVGIVIKEVTSADADYAENTEIAVPIPSVKGALMEGPVGTGTIAVTDVGNTYDLKDHISVDQTGTTYNAVRLYKRLSATLGQWTIEAAELR